MKTLTFLAMFLTNQLVSWIGSTFMNIPTDKAFMNIHGYAFCLAVFFLMIVIDVDKAKDENEI